jgi:hypothetical protein
MRSKTIIIMAAAVLFLPTIGHAQPSEGRGIYHRDGLKNARDDVRANSKPDVGGVHLSHFGSHQFGFIVDQYGNNIGWRNPIGQITQIVDTARAEAKRNPDNFPAEAHKGDTGWTFAVLTIRKSAEGSTVKREPYGVFTGPKDCKEARAKKILELDDLNYRQPHTVPNAPVITTTITVGATSITTQKPDGPTETMNVTDCAADAETISAGSEVAQRN